MEELREKNLTRKECRALARKNGINDKTFDSRVFLGWDPFRAATTVSESRTGKPYSRRSYEEIAADNGISKTRFYARVRKGWPMKAAATTPLRKYNKKKDEVPDVQNTESAPVFDLPDLCGDSEKKQAELTLDYFSVWGKLDLEQKEKLVNIVKIVSAEAFGIDPVREIIEHGDVYVD